jgi:hypothetical protein
LPKAIKSRAAEVLEAEFLECAREDRYDPIARCQIVEHGFYLPALNLRYPVIVGSGDAPGEDDTIEFARGILLKSFR